MGAKLRQVLQVNRKNSTSCSSPESSLTVVGSVASRFCPREVAATAIVGTATVPVDCWLLTSGVVTGAGLEACGRSVDSMSPDPILADPQAVINDPSIIRTTGKATRKFMFLILFIYLFFQKGYELDFLQW
jgi:hypothetical protein